MIKVKVEQELVKYDLIEPINMFKYKKGTVFQEYVNGKPDKWFFVNLGLNEDLLVIWYNDEMCKYELSTDNKKGISGLLSHVKCKVVDMKLEILLTDAYEVVEKHLKEEG